MCFYLHENTQPKQFEKVKQDIMLWCPHEYHMKPSEFYTMWKRPYHVQITSPNNVALLVREDFYNDHNVLVNSHKLQKYYHGEVTPLSSWTSRAAKTNLLSVSCITKMSQNFIKMFTWVDILGNYYEVEKNNQIWGFVFFNKTYRF